MKASARAAFSSDFRGITPETETSAFYFWSSAHNFMIDKPEVTQRIFEEIARTFEKIVWCLAQQKE